VALVAEEPGDKGKEQTTSGAPEKENYYVGRGS